MILCLSAPGSEQAYSIAASIPASTRESVSQTAPRTKSLARHHHRMIQVPAASSLGGFPTRVVVARSRSLPPRPASENLHLAYRGKRLLSTWSGYSLVFQIAFSRPADMDLLPIVSRRVRHCTWVVRFKMGEAGAPETRCYEINTDVSSILTEDSCNR